VKTSSSKQGTLSGGSLLIAGSCIGAGMLALPVKASICGLYPFLTALLVSLVLMVLSGFALLEVNRWSGSGNVVTMADKTLGPFGKAVVWITYAFLFYSLMVAYVAASARLVAYFLTDGEQYLTLLHVVVAVIMGGLVFLGTRAVDYFNRFLMVGLVVSYFSLLAVGLPHIDVSNYEMQNWDEIPWMFPILIIMFGYHNLIPSLYAYCNQDSKKMKKAVVVGCCTSFVVYTLWQVVILGVIPSSGAGGLQELEGSGDLIIKTLKETVKGSSAIVISGQLFSLFAILTSFIGVALSFVDFLSDGLSAPKNPKGRFVLVVAALAPALAFSLLSPNIFMMALDYAGAFGAAILFGIIPVAMAWKVRYKLGGKERIFPGGKIALFLLGLCFLSIVLLKVFRGI
jgi:tyrosine-specific transport protein